MSDLRDQITNMSPEQRRGLEERLLAARSARSVPGAIGPRPADTQDQLSFGQERVWRLSRLMGESAAYNIHACHRIRGPLDVEALRAGLEDLARRHETLRTVFDESSGQPRILPPARFELEVEDLGSEPDPLQHVAEWAERPMDLSHGPLFAARLWRLGPDHHLLSLLAHHLVCDGWSMSLLEGQLADAYAGVAAGADQPKVGYADFVAWERSQEQDLRGQLAFWSTTLEGVPALQLPGDRGAEAGEVAIELSASTSAAIDDLARRTRATPFTVLLAIFAATLQRHTGQEDMVVCTPVAGRPDPVLEGIVGYFNDLSPIRARLDGDPTILSLIDRLRPAVLGAVGHSVPFQWIASLPETSSTPLARALFALNEMRGRDLHLPGLTDESVEVPSSSSDFELGWYVRAQGGRYLANVRYRAGTEAAIRQLTADFVAFAELMCSTPDMRLSALPDRSAPRQVIESRPEEAAQPRSLLESRLQRIWQRVFGRPIGVNDNFFDLGGHSLLAVELIGEIEAELSSDRIPLATLIGAPTVSQFANLLESGGWRKSWRSLVPIKPTGSGTPLFFVHAHGGNVIGYTDLARHLSEDQPLYGLQAPDMDQVRGRRRIEDMANTYIREIRSVQAEGPYLLGGYCLGATVAFEMAHQLKSQGDEVALVLMVDNPRPEFARGAELSAPSRLAYRVGNRLWGEWSNLAEVPWGQKGGYLVERTARLIRRLGAAIERRLTGADGRLPFGMGHSRTYRQEELAAFHEKAYEEYHPRPYPGPVAIFRAARQALGRATDPSLGWAPMIAGRMALFELPGYRVNLLSEPRIQQVAPIIEGAIRDAIVDEGSR